MTYSGYNPVIDRVIAFLLPKKILFKSCFVDMAQDYS